MDAPAAHVAAPRGGRDGDDDSTWTVLGTIDGSARAFVDAAGLVSPGPGRPSVDWWIGADDRWHAPASEAAVRQQLVRGTPVVETAMRVPGGDAVHRACAVRLPSAEGGGDAVLIEVENRTAIPFALALALRPFDRAGPVEVGEVAIHGTVIEAGGSPALVVARPPNRAVAGTAAGGDLFEVVTTGGAVEATFDRVVDPQGRAQAAVVVPVPHGTTFRAVVPLDATPAGFPTVLPAADDVAEGWRVQLRDAARAVLPDPGRTAAFDALPGALVLAAAPAVSGDGAPDDLAALGGALDAVGRHGEAAEVLVEALRRTDDLTADGRATSATERAVALAVAAHLALAPDADLAAAAVDLAARAAQALAAGARPRRRLLGGRGGDAVAGDVDAGSVAADLHALARLLHSGGEVRAAADARAVAERLGAGGGIQAAVTGDRGGDLDALLAQASSTVTWPGGWARAARVTAALVASVVEAGPAGLALAPHVPLTWLGQGFEAHNISTRCGVVSYAVRWHGQRPALLWEIEPTAGGGAVTVTAPGLDPTWSSTELRGEALLAPVPVPDQPVEGGRPAGVVIGGLQIGRRPPGESRPEGTEA